MGTSDYNGFLTQKSKKFYSDLSGLNSNKKITLPLSEIKDSVEKMMFFENFLSRIPDYGNLYTDPDADDSSPLSVRK